MDIERDINVSVFETNIRGIDQDNMFMVTIGFMMFNQFIQLEVKFKQLTSIPRIMSLSIFYRHLFVRG